MGQTPRVFSREFKGGVVQRILAGESPSALSRELAIRRKLLYEWRDQYRRGGADLLRTPGRPAHGAVTGSSVRAGRSQAAPQESKLAELERKVGRQQVVIDFLEGALRRVEGESVKTNSSGASGCIHTSAK
jgi:transposase-like protein